MIELKGDSLGNRQQEINIKVNEAVARKIDFDVVKAEPHISDVDMIFKIDLAAKYKNIEYVIAVLKSGDSMHITRVLKKCVWLCDDEYSNIVNAEYLSQNVFPFMSIKMKRKTLIAIYEILKDDKRAADFYKYCLDEKLSKIATKFLILTTEAFKLNVIRTDKLTFDCEEDKSLKCFIGNSIKLLEAYVHEQGSWTGVVQCSHLYFVADVKYLELFEKHAADFSEISYTYYYPVKFGLRISKDIMKKHKDRVINNPKAYIKFLNTSKIVRHCSAKDAKLLITNLMPNNADRFWEVNFYESYKSVVDILPAEERYTFLKKMFSDHYPDQKFEMCEKFYNLDYYTMMNAKEQEEWALQQIASGTEMLGPGNDYIWYKFVNFEMAFSKLKASIKVTTDRSKRTDITEVLVESAKSNRDLERLFKYYYERHVNEVESYKARFIKKVIACHDVFEFDEDCWRGFNKLLYSMDVYDTSGRSKYDNFKTVALIYHILNVREIPHALVKYLESNQCVIWDIYYYWIKMNNEKKKILYDYILNFLVKKITSFDFEEKALSDLKKIKTEVYPYINRLLQLMSKCKKTYNDIPEIVMKFIRLDPESYSEYSIHREVQSEEGRYKTESDFIKTLKTGTEKAVEIIPKVKQIQCYNNGYYLKKFLSKLKIYYSNHIIAQRYLDYFHKIIAIDEYVPYDEMYMAVFGIFQLSDEESIVNFMNKYAPVNSKIEDDSLKSDVEQNALRIQEAICRFACYSRPPVPLTKIMMYIKGDYVKFCLPMFNMYLANLPMPLCLKFVESILDTPVSVQKHGLRLAFKCFSTENLSKLIVDSWKNTKNVSLRSVIYKAFSEKVAESEKRDMFEVLKTLTSDLHEDDDEDLFNVLADCRFSNNFRGELLEVAWRTVNKFSKKHVNLQRRALILRSIENNIELLRRDTLSTIIEENLEIMLTKQSNQEVVSLIEQLWELTANFVIYFTRTEEERQESVEFTKFLMNKFLEKWNNVADGAYIYRKMLSDLIYHMDNKSCTFNTENCENCIPVFNAILEDLQAKLPLHEIYYFSWKLRLLIINRKLIESGRQKHRLTNTSDCITEAAFNFGREIGKLVKDSVEKNIYSTHFFTKICDIIGNDASYILIYIHLECGRNAKMTHHDILLEIARGLLEEDTVETRLLALELLPKDPEGNVKAYKPVLDKIRQGANIDIETYAYDKYYGDFKRRRFV